MKLNALAILATLLATVSFMDSPTALAGKPCRKTVTVSQVTYPQPASQQKCDVPNATVSLLVSLEKPVHLRVNTCETELQTAVQNLRTAVCRRDNAQAAAATTLSRAEATACILKKMDCNVVINGLLFNKEEVATALNTLLSQYRSASCDAKAAESVVAERVTELKQVKDRVVKWQQVETALLAQVAVLRAEQDATKQANLKTAANELIAQVNTMLSTRVSSVAAAQVETVAVNVQTVSAQQPLTVQSASKTSDSAQANDAQVNELLREVDQVLAGR